MIFGEYPCCNGPLVLYMPDKTPVWEKETCTQCGAVVWHWLARIGPVSFTEADFLDAYEVNEETKHITLRPGKAELVP